MQIQSVNNTPNFQANYLRTAKQTVKSGLYTKQTPIDIYSIDSRDRDLIEKLLVKVDLVRDRRDEIVLNGKKRINETIRYVLNKALHLDEKSQDGVFIAVQNNKYLCGLLDFSNGSSPELKNLTSWRGNKNDITRSNLLAEFLQCVEKANNNRKWYDKVNITAYSKPESNGNKWLKQNGFGFSDGSESAIRERLVMKSDVISSSRKSLEQKLENAGVDINKNLKPSQVELKKLNL